MKLVGRKHLVPEKSVKMNFLERVVKNRLLAWERTQQEGTNESTRGAQELLRMSVPAVVVPADGTAKVTEQIQFLEGLLEFGRDVEMELKKLKEDSAPSRDSSPSPEDHGVHFSGKGASSIFFSSSSPAIEALKSKLGTFSRETLEDLARVRIPPRPLNSLSFSSFSPFFPLLTRVSPVRNPLKSQAPWIAVWSSFSPGSACMVTVPLRSPLPPFMFHRLLLFPAVAVHMRDFSTKKRNLLVLFLLPQYMLECLEHSANEANVNGILLNFVVALFREDPQHLIAEIL